MSDIKGLYREYVDVMEAFNLSWNEAEVVASTCKKFINPFKLLNQYDNKRIDLPLRSSVEDVGNMMFADEEEWSKLGREFYELKVQTAYNLVAFIKQKFPENSGFGDEREEGALESIIHSIYQNAFGQGYHTPMGKASNLLYFVIKNHPFVNGNKRIAVFLFCVFVEMHAPKLIEKTIGYAALPAMALFIAVSDSRDKELIVNLVMRIFSED